MIENIFAYLSTVFSFSCYIFMYKILSKNKLIIKFKYILTVVVVSCISYLFTKNNLVVLNLFSNLFFVCYFNKLFSNNEVKACIYYGMISFIIILFSDALTSMLISNYNIMNFDIFLKNQLLRTLLVFPVFIFAIIISALPPIKFFVRLLFDKFLNKITITKKFFQSLLSIIILITILFLLNAYNRVNKFGHFTILLGITTLAVLLIAVLYFMYQEYQIKQVNKKIIEENNYIKNIAKQDEEFKHNLINNLLGIKTISNKETNKLIDELINDYRQDYKNITNINDLPNGVQSIIYRKAFEENIDDLNLIVDNSIEKELYDILNPKKYNHLCTAIGILFDNALQAVKDNTQKVIEINFLEDNENIYFVLKNSFSNFIDLEEFGKRNVTTKINGHGIGINYVSKLKTLELKNEIINNMFVSKLIIKK